ncbi:hypothetical protein BSPA111_10200 [Buttiauxella sp. A111]|nr:hypothetical protein BSPA111_10200 [Buttiauxella sp. A111]
MPGSCIQSVDLGMNNTGIRDSARALHVSINAGLCRQQKASALIVLRMDKNPVGKFIYSFFNR